MISCSKACVARARGPSRSRSVCVRAAAQNDGPARAVLRGLAASAIALNLALSPAALAALPDGVATPGQTQLDELLEAKLAKIRASGLANEDPSGAPVRVETTYDADRKPMGGARREADKPAPAAIAAEEPKVDIRQAAIDAAAAEAEARAAAPATVAGPVKVPLAKRAPPAASAASDAPAPNSTALIGGAIAVVAVAGVAAAANKGEEQQSGGAAPTAPTAMTGTPEQPAVAPAPEGANGEPAAPAK